MAKQVTLQIDYNFEYLTLFFVQNTCFLFFVSIKALAKGDDAMQAVKIEDFKRA